MENNAGNELKNNVENGISGTVAVETNENLQPQSASAAQQTVNYVAKATENYAASSAANYAVPPMENSTTPFVFRPMNEKPSFWQKYKKIILIAVPVLLVIAVVMIILVVKNADETSTHKRLSDTEKQTIEIVRSLVNMMKDPDSFKLREDVLVVTDNENEKYYYIHYSANNSYGAAITDIAMFHGTEYCGNYDDEYDSSGVDNQKKFECKWMFDMWKWETTPADGGLVLESEQVESWEFVSMKKIAKELKIQYVE